jgi:radical SAM protein with 4Fe4S-binding SPASM domain
MGYYTFSPDRTIFPCHRLVGSPEHKVPEDNIKNIDNIDYQWRRTAAKKDICKDCPARFFCAGGCRQENLINTKSLSGVCVPVCRFSNTLLFSALIAYQGLTDTVKERISQNSSMDLFTFCGQPVLKKT